MAVHLSNMLVSEFYSTEHFLINGRLAVRNVNLMHTFEVLNLDRLQGFLTLCVLLPQKDGDYSLLVGNTLFYGLPA